MLIQDLHIFSSDKLSTPLPLSWPGTVNITRDFADNWRMPAVTIRFPAVVLINVNDRNQYKPLKFHFITLRYQLTSCRFVITLVHIRVNLFMTKIDCEVKIDVPLAPWNQHVHYCAVQAAARVVVMESHISVTSRVEVGHKVPVTYNQLFLVIFHKSSTYTSVRAV